MAKTQSRRNAPPSGRQDRRRRPRASWLVIAVALLALNYLAASRATRAPALVRVPYSPFFVRQIAVGNVAKITSKGTAIQGTFKHPARYAGSRPTTRFETEIPEFADTQTLARSLARAGVVVNAQPLQTTPPWWENVLLNFGPTLLFLGLLIGLSRRGASAQSLLGSFG